MSRWKFLLGISALATAITLGVNIDISPKNISASQNLNVPMPEEIVQQNQKAAGEAEIYLAGGCFWGTEFLMRNVPGVVSVEVGYSNGMTRNPTYREVCKGSGHAESAHVIYNPQIVSLSKILSIYYQSIDPTFVNREGNERDMQYRSGIYFSNPDDEPVIRESLKHLQSDFFNQIFVENKPIKNFYRAEEEHQEYLMKNPNGYCHVTRPMIDEQAKAKVAGEFSDKNFSRNRVYSKPTKETLKNLSELQRAVTQNGATEPPFRNEYDEEFREGIYVDVTNGQPLFLSTDKFESGCGWPSFSKAINKDYLVERIDRSYGIERTEIRAKASGSHLGHVFNDYPKTSEGIRYCINSSALRFIPRENMAKEGYGEWLSLFK